MITGLHLMCAGCPQSRLCDDMFRRGERRLFIVVRFNNEVHRSSAINGTRCYSSRSFNRRSPRLEATSGERICLLHSLRTLGSRWRRLADSSKRWVSISLKYHFSCFQFPTYIRHICFFVRENETQNRFTVVAFSARFVFFLPFLLRFAASIEVWI